MISVKKIAYTDCGTIYYKNSDNMWKRKKNKYKKAKEKLEKHYGNRCLFCNRKLTNREGNNDHHGDHYSIEHLKEKSNNESLASNIQNLVLACIGCNGKRGVSEIGDTPISHGNIFSTYEILPDGKIVPKNTEVQKTITAYGLNRKKLMEERELLIKSYQAEPKLLDIDINNINNSKKDELDILAVTIKFAELSVKYQKEVEEILNDCYNGGI